MTERDSIAHNLEAPRDLLVVGAGMAGLTAASELRRSGFDLLVVDKGRGVGGRMASRRIGAATFDHGAQFITAHDPRFVPAMDRWEELGVIEEWFRSPMGPIGGRPHWRGNPSMTAIPKRLAGQVDVLLGKRVAALNGEPTSWRVRLESGESIVARAVLLTPPVPQTLALLDAGGVVLPSEVRTELEGIGYEPCLAVMAVLDGPSRIPRPGWLEPEEGPIAWIADNQAKGISELPAVTLHATAAFSRDHWDRDRQEIGAELLRAGGPMLEAGVTEFQVHGWLYSRPIGVDRSLCRVLSQSPPLVLAGDAFAGPHVEGAAISGGAAAEVLKQMDLGAAAGD